MSKLSADAQFFFEHAGFSHNPATETPEQGRTRCALNLAAAESFARAAGVAFDWSIDPDTTSGDWDENTNYALWQCLAYDSAGNVCGSLGGVDFGEDGEPWGQNYRRVVEAEMAAEYMTETMQGAQA